MEDLLTHTILLPDYANQYSPTLYHMVNIQYVSGPVKYDQTFPRQVTERVVQNRIDNLSSSTVTAIVEEYLLRTKKIECKAAVLNGKSEKKVTRRLLAKK